MEHNCVKDGVIGELTARMDNMEKRQEATDKLVESVHSLAIEMTYVKDNVTKISATLESLKSRPVEFWQKVFFIVFTALAGVIVGKYF